MQDQLNAILAKAAAELPAVRARPEFEAAKARYVGPNGEFTSLMKQMGAVPKEQRPVVGRLVNEAKSRLQEHLDAALARGSRVVRFSCNSGNHQTLRLAERCGATMVGEQWMHRLDLPAEGAPSSPAPPALSAP